MATTPTRNATDWLADALLDLAPGQRVFATDIPWAVYTRLADLRDERRPGVKITFDRGRIEFVSPRFRHERLSFWLRMIVLTLAEEFNLELISAGATTFRPEEGEQGLEAHESFYVAHAQDVMGVDDIDLTVHPPPDLVIEVDLTSSSVPKELMYGPMGVPELWRHDDDEVAIRRLQPNGKYQTAPRSLAFPLVTAADLTRLLVEGRDEGEIAFVRRCRTWAKTLVTPPAQP
ncbi:MAG TPA: Uma2 family endonuclease [Gemmataceae bacterium]|nr:Uma2 family endonuclease [Gemmataceae bacterium]